MALDPITAGMNLLGSIIDRVFPDKTQAAAAKAHLAELDTNGEISLMLGQMKINEVEAASTNWLVAGWRPFVGWVCGAGLGYQFLVYPLAVAIFPSIAAVDTTLLLPILGGLIGLRSLDKYHGTDTK